MRPSALLGKVLSFINFAAREINCKIVYYGAGLGGKTTNLQHIYQKTAEQQKGKMISLATETERTLFFDFLPLDLGSVRGFKTRIHLYTVPGQVFYDASRKLILRGPPEVRHVSIVRMTPGEPAIVDSRSSIIASTLLRESVMTWRPETVRRTSV